MNQWSYLYDHYSNKIRSLNGDHIEKILTRGRLANNSIPFFADLNDFTDEYDRNFIGESTEFLVERPGKLPRKFLIPSKDKYEDLVATLKNYWEHIFPSPVGNCLNLQDIILSNKKILPISAYALLEVDDRSSLARIQLFQINIWKQFTQNHLYKETPNYRFIISADIKEYYRSIYVHGVEWAIIGDKSYCKTNHGSSSYKSGIWSSINKKLMALHDSQTNGIAIGNYANDLISEIILSRVVEQLENDLSHLDFIGTRFKDDFKILCKTEEDCNQILKKLTLILSEYDLLIQEKGVPMISKNFSSLLFKEWKPLFYTMLPNDNSAEREKLLLFLYHIENSESLREGNFWFEFQKFLRDKIVQLDGETKKIVLAWLYNMLDKDLMRVGSPLDVIYEILTTFSETDPWYVCDFWKMLETKLIANFHRDGVVNHSVWFMFYSFILGDEIVNGSNFSVTFGSNKFMSFMYNYLKSKDRDELLTLKPTHIYHNS